MRVAKLIKEDWLIVLPRVYILYTRYYWQTKYLANMLLASFKFGDASMSIFYTLAKLIRWGARLRERL